MSDTENLKPQAKKQKTVQNKKTKNANNKKTSTKKASGNNKSTNKNISNNKKATSNKTFSGAKKQQNKATANTNSQTNNTQTNNSSPNKPKSARAKEREERRAQIQSYKKATPKKREFVPYELRNNSLFNQETNNQSNTGNNTNTDPSQRKRAKGTTSRNYDRPERKPGEPEINPATGRPYDLSQSRESLIRVKKRRKNTKKIKRKKRIKIIVPSVIGAAILAFVILFIVGCLGMHGGAGDPGKVIWYKGHKYVYNEDVISGVFIGYDQTAEDMEQGRNGQADFIEVLALDTKNNKLRAISIPRDCMTEFEQYGSDNYIGMSDKKQIALSFANGENIEKGSESTRNAVQRLLYNMPINKYYSLDTDGIGFLSSAIGGVTLTALETIQNTNIVEGKKVTLMGEDARAYVKSRGQDVMGSERRRKRDVQFMEEYYKQGFKKIAKSVKTLWNIYEAGKVFSTSNLNPGDLLYCAFVAFTADVDKLETYSIQGETKDTNPYVEFWPDDTSLFETMLAVFYEMVE